ncbi:uncharacterized protein BHQ10_002545 [Talaromyces amestolkiae]|uniref:beta-fructofuranosidase n=1 Tax=Talaromyces amestolkiae TaxID=1196081 RepID=A0A364KSL8_TALAM|nr:uncharacterized protein BHQ10_002545 [Talaromyces amestolkiae]RAO66533.1 hypothetical protein BHQ10_002545 [Talaromyces amestolkiae]
MSAISLTASFSRPTGYAAAGDTIPFLQDDTYHLFQLSSPPDTLYHPPRVRCTWTRQRSQDLIQWKRDEMPVISPGQAKTDFDSDGSWTGSAVLGPDGHMHIFYTGYNLLENGKQVILHAKSTDRQGTQFTKPEAPICIESGSLEQYEATDFRDPYVFFHEPESQYWMLVATRLAKGPYWTRGCVALLTSKDLKAWTVASQPLHSPNNIFCPECPELFTLGNGKWYLLYSRFSAPHPGTLYMIADNPRGPFHLPRDCSGGVIDGRRWYAAKSCARAGDPSKRIAFGWVHDYVEADSKWLWGGSTTQPREYSARMDGTLQCSVLPEIEKRLQEAGTMFNDHSKQLILNGPGTTVAKAVSTPQCDFYLTFALPKAEANSFGLMLDYDDDMRGYRISFQHVASQYYSVTLVCDMPPFDDFWADLTSHSIPKLVDGPELVRHGAVRLDQPMTLIRSGDIIEFFVGGKVITYRLPQRSKTSAKMKNSVGLFVEDGEIEFNLLRCVPVRYL